MTIIGFATVAAIAVGSARAVAVGLAIGAAMSAAYGVYRTFTPPDTTTRTGGA